MSAKPFARANILGVGVSAINMQMAVSQIEEWVARREPNYVIAAPVNCIIECVGTRISERSIIRGNGHSGWYAPGLGQQVNGLHSR